MPKLDPDDPALLALEAVAVQAGIALGMTVERRPPRDQTLAWKAIAVHPLQALETEYQGIVQDAVREVADPDLRRDRESAATAGFFLFDAAEPRLLGVGPGEAYRGDRFPLPDDRLNDARRQLKAANAQLALPPQQADWAAIVAHLHAALADALALVAACHTLPCSAGWPVPPVTAAVQELANLGPAIDAAAVPATYAAVAARIGAALDQIEIVLTGLAAVQMIHFIEGFYLFRLLVPFRLTSSRPIPKASAMQASGAVTALVTNGHPWLSDWLRDCLVSLAARLDAVDPSGNTLFFLKGGRALRYLMGQPGTGENDWDTQIVINPDLPPAQWYALFRHVSNAVLIALKQFKTEFFMLLHAHAADFRHEIAADRIAEGPAPDDAWDELARGMDLGALDALMRWAYGRDEDDLRTIENGVPVTYRENCKAELIDVVLPRHGTVEAREQWERLRGSVLRDPIDGMPFPDAYYYLAEYLLMLRESCAGNSPSPAKMVKRLQRLAALIAAPQAAAAIAAEHAAIPPALLPLSLAQVATLPPNAVAILSVLLHQFVDAFDLIGDQGLAGAFDARFANGIAVGPYPPPVPAIAPPPGGSPGALGPLIGAIDYGHVQANAMLAHLALREAWLVTQPSVSTFVATLFGQAMFDQFAVLEVQMALDGAAAARAHAADRGYAHGVAMEPVAFVSIGLYAAHPDARADQVMALVEPIVAGAMIAFPGLVLVPDPVDHALRIYNGQPVAIAPYTYAPLVVEIAVRPMPAKPLLAWIAGQPVLSLADLIGQYQRRAAHIEEYATRTLLRGTIAALTEMAVRAADPTPPDPTLEAMRRGACHHLTISSDQFAAGGGTGYPPAYLPDAMFRVILSDDRAGLRARLTLGTPPPGPAPDRTLDLLVVDQGTGAPGRFAGWSVAEIAANLVAPLLASGVTARIVVLDFPASASLIGAFAALAPAGTLYATLYDPGRPIVTTATWAALRAPLAARDSAAIRAAIEARMIRITGEITGAVHLDPIRTATGAQVAAHLLVHPADRDAVSIVRYLPRIADAFACSGGVLDRELAALRAVNSANMGYAELPILALVPPPPGILTSAGSAAIEAQLRQRVVSILQAPHYGIGAAIGARPLFGGAHALWREVEENRAWLMAQAQGFARCPSPLVAYDATSTALTLDHTLALAPIAPAALDLIGRADPAAPAQVPMILAAAMGAIGYLDPVADYMQP